MSEQLTYREAVSKAIGDAMAVDDSVFALGEDIGAAGGALKLTEGLFERFGPQRVLDTPISEQAIVGTAIGAAMLGLRPVAELMFSDFAAVCFDGVANELPKLRYMTGGQVSLPVTIRLTNGAAGFAARRTQQPVENWFLNIPGLKIALPGTVADAYWLLRAAIDDPDPVLVFEHRRLLGLKGAIEERNGFRLGVAETVRAGTDVSVVAPQLMRQRCLEAADVLAAESISVEVIDPRTLVPFDDATVITSLEKTSRLVVVQEAPPAGSWGASLIARLTEQHFQLFDAPPMLVAADETPIPYAESLEEAWLPGVARIIEVVRRAAFF